MVKCESLGHSVRGFFLFCIIIVTILKPHFLSHVRYNKHMKWNPLINAALAAAYIFGIAALFRYIAYLGQGVPDSIIDPIGVLSVLVFSVAVMGFLFFYRPVILLLENKRDEAISYFLRTLGLFGIITLLVLLSILGIQKAQI